MVRNGGQKWFEMILNSKKWSGKLPMFRMVQKWSAANGQKFSGQKWSGRARNGGEASDWPDRLGGLRMARHGLEEPCFFIQ